MMHFTASMKDIVSTSNAKFMMILAMSMFGTIGVITHFIDLPSSIIVLGRRVSGSLVFGTSDIILVVLLGIVQTAIAFTLYFGSLSYLDAPRAAIFGYIELILGILLSVVILHEDLGPIGWIGAAIVLGSTLVPEITAQISSRSMVRWDHHAGQSTIRDRQLYL